MNIFQVLFWTLIVVIVVDIAFIVSVIRQDNKRLKELEGEG